MTKDVAWSVVYRDIIVGYVGIMEKKMETAKMGGIWEM